MRANHRTARHPPARGAILVAAILLLQACGGAPGSTVDGEPSDPVYVAVRSELGALADGTAVESMGYVVQADDRLLIVSVVVDVAPCGAPAEEAWIELLGAPADIDFDFFHGGLWSDSYHVSGTKQGEAIDVDRLTFVEENHRRSQPGCQS